MDLLCEHAGQARTGRAVLIDGTGLGLPISKKLVSAAFCLHVHSLTCCAHRDEVSIGWCCRLRKWEGH